MGLFSSIGGILGGVVGSIIPGVGTAIGATVGAGLGGAAGSAIDANQANKKAQGYYNQQMGFAQSQAQFQQDYIRNMMQWRVEDAKNAGVHPMAAFGVSNPSYSPVSAPSAPAIYDSSQFDTGSTFGQSLNRAAMADKNQAQQEKVASLGFQQIGLQNQGLSLDNQYKALQVAQLASELQRNAASMSPAPGGNGLIGGQTDTITGLKSPKDSAYHVWDMGDGNFDILMNPDYQQTIGDEFGQVATTLKGITRAKQGVWVNPEDGVSYVFDAGSGYFRRLSSLSDEEARRLLGSGSARTSGPSSTHRERNKYRYR